MTDRKNRCVVTGLGMVSAIGNTVAECWKNALAGQSGIAPTTSVDTENCYANLAAEVHATDLDDSPHASEMDRVSKLCVKACREALADADLAPAALSDAERSRFGVIMGSCVGGVLSVEAFYKEGESPDHIPKMPISAIANMVAREFGAGGVVTNVANACAAGTISIAYACDLIRCGVADAFLVGGADAFASVPYAGFLSLHALDTAPCSPFNRCSGITLGEGSGALVVESYDHAVARGARIYCEVLGSGISSDAHHITAPRPDGEGQMFAIRRAMENSGVSPRDIGYINAHGTGTAKNDEAEFLSLHTLFDHTGAELSVSSTKAMVGHCLGAAGAIEAVFAVKALTENQIPPTVGYTEEDLIRLRERAGEIDFRPNTAREKELTTVMSNSFAFGGNNAGIVFSKTPGNLPPMREKERVFITGLGIVSPVGNGVAAYCDAASVPALCENGCFEPSVTKEDYDRVGLKMAFYRKLDRFSQLQAVSGMEALADAHLTVTEANAQSIGIVVGTADGPLATVCDFQKDLVAKGNAAGSAFKFPNTVYNAAGGYLSICSGIKGYNVTVTNGAQSGLAGIAYGRQILQNGQSRTVLATGTDEAGEILSHLYDRLELRQKDATLPYSGKTGFSLGGGSTTLVLETASAMQERGAIAYAELIGCGMAHKAVPFGTLSGSAEGLAAAIANAVADAGISLAEIDGIVGFGNGMKSIDALELSMYRSLFGQRLGSMPLFTVKDRCGEGRAATAALSAAEAALLLAGKYQNKRACFAGDTVTWREVQPAACKLLLVTSFAAGGSYTALLLRRAESCDGRE